MKNFDKARQYSLQLDQERRERERQKRLAKKSQQLQPASSTMADDSNPDDAAIQQEHDQLKQDFAAMRKAFDDMKKLHDETVAELTRLRAQPKDNPPTSASTTPTGGEGDTDDPNAAETEHTNDQSNGSEPTSDVPPGDGQAGFFQSLQQNIQTLTAGLQQSLQMHSQSSNNPIIHMELRNVKPFSNDFTQSIDDWVRAMKKVFENASLPAKDQPEVLVSKLKGAPLALAKRILSTSSDVEQVFAELRKAYQTEEDKSKAMSDFTNRKQGDHESVTQFGQALFKAAKLALGKDVLSDEQHERWLRSNFKNGLRRNLQRFAVSAESGASTPAKYFELVKRTAQLAGSWEPEVAVAEHNFLANRGYADRRSYPARSPSLDRSRGIAYAVVPAMRSAHSVGSGDEGTDGAASTRRSRCVSPEAGGSALGYRKYQGQGTGRGAQSGSVMRQYTKQCSAHDTGERGVVPKEGEERIFPDCICDFCGEKNHMQRDCLLNPHRRRWSSTMRGRGGYRGRYNTRSQQWPNQKDSRDNSRDEPRHVKFTGDTKTLARECHPMALPTPEPGSIDLTEMTMYERAMLPQNENRSQSGFTNGIVFSAPAKSDAVLHRCSGAGQLCKIGLEDVPQPYPADEIADEDDYLVDEHVSNDLDRTGNTIMVTSEGPALRVPRKPQSAAETPDPSKPTDNHVPNTSQTEASLCYNSPHSQTRLMTMDADFEGRKMMALFDSGCSHSCITTDTAKILNLPILPLDNLTMRTATGEVIPVHGRVVVPLRVGGCAFKAVELVVADVANYDVYLGLDFIRTLSPFTVHYDEGTTAVSGHIECHRAEKSLTFGKCAVAQTDIPCHVIEASTVPPHSAFTVRLKVAISLPVGTDLPFEPNSDALQKVCLVVPHAVVTLRQDTGSDYKHIVVEGQNFSPRSARLYARQNLGTVCSEAPVDDAHSDSTILTNSPKPRPAMPLGSRDVDDTHTRNKDSPATGNYAVNPVTGEPYPAEWSHAKRYEHTKKLRKKLLARSRRDMKDTAYICAPSNLMPSPAPARTNAALTLCPFSTNDGSTNMDSTTTNSTPATSPSASSTTQPQAALDNQPQPAQHTDVAGKYKNDLFTGQPYPAHWNRARRRNVTMKQAAVLRRRR